MIKFLYIILVSLFSLTVITCSKKDVSASSSSPATYSTSVQSFRILEQAKYGPTEADMNEVQSLGLNQWVEKQLNSSSAYDSSTDYHQSHLQKYKAIAKMSDPSTYVSDLDFNNNFHGRTSNYQIVAWFENALHGKDQLQQRVVLALSELMVISGSKQRTRFKGDSLTSYYDILVKYAFGNFWTLIEEVSRSPGMGIFLSHQGNKKFKSSSNTHPDENFARELMKLFSIGPWKMDQDGSMVKDSNGDSNGVPIVS